MPRKLLHNGKHLTLEDRTIIEQCVTNGDKLRVIGERLHKDPTTVKKEIHNHREPVTGYASDYCTQCQLYPHCKSHHRNGPYCMNGSCEHYLPFTCARRDRSPGACNGCKDIRSCHFQKYRYYAKTAQHNYEDTLSGSRSGFHMTESEADEKGTLIAPLIKKGQSLAHIRANHPELGVCERTLYNYVSNGAFAKQNIGNLDLRLKVKRRQRRKKMPKSIAKLYRKRKDNAYLEGRTYEDYKAYIDAHPNTRVLQMDTVYNDNSNGPFIQTLKFIPFQLQIGVYQLHKEAKDMCEGIEWLEQILGPECFRKYVEVILTDRGSEFAWADTFEHSKDGSQRTRIFYCDPMRSTQKGSCEQKHTSIRTIVPKKVDMQKNGLVSQEALNELFSNVDSIHVDSLGGLCAMEYTSKHAPDLYEKLCAAGFRHVPGDDVVLTKSALRAFVENDEGSETEKEDNKAEKEEKLET